MAKWIDLGEIEKFPLGEKRAASAQGARVVICHVAAPENPQAQDCSPGCENAGHAQLTAILDQCPHAGLPLSEGDLTDTTLTCAFHGYAFNVCTGKNIDYPDDTPVTRLPVKIDHGRVFVDIEGHAP
jgi:hypothetical protein